LQLVHALAAATDLLHLLLLLALQGDLLLRVHLRRRRLRAAATRAGQLVLRGGRGVVLAAAGDNLLIVSSIVVQLVVATNDIVTGAHSVQLANVASVTRGAYLLRRARRDTLADKLVSVRRRRGLLRLQL
jgi:hypothetical protein